MTTGSEGLPAPAARRLELINWLQLVTLVGGLVVGAMAIGRKDAELAQHSKELAGAQANLEKLAAITADLARTDVRQDEQIASIRDRLSNLERRP